MIIHLTGADSYRSARRLADLRAAFVAKHDPQGFNTVTVDAETATVEELHAALTTSGFFAKKRFVAVDRYGREAKISPAELVETIGPYVTQDHDVVVVLRDLTAHGPAKPARRPAKGKKVTAKKSMSEVIWPEAKREEFPALTEPQAITWVQTLAKNHGSAFESEAAKRLVALTSLDSWRLAAETEKLAAYAGQRAITSADVESMVTSEYASDIFALTDALGQRQTARALELLHRELNSGMNEFALISTLAGHIRNLWQVKTSQADGTTPGVMAERLGLHPYVVQKAASQVRHFSADQLSALHHRLVQIDHDLKTSPLDAETLLDLLLTEA